MLETIKAVNRGRGAKAGKGREASAAALSSA
jgi:hypothetical protein